MVPGVVGEDAPMLIIVISGPIASGKSSLGRAVAARLDEVLDARSAVIDLDLVYEMLDPRGGVKNDDALWSEARRVAGQLAAVLFGGGRCVVAEGGFATDRALGEFESKLPPEATLRLVLLEADLETALQRVRTDPGRGLSRDASFLSQHYESFRAEWARRDVLRVDTRSAAPADTARVVAPWLTR